MPSQAPAATYKCPCKTKTKSCNRHMQRRQCEDRDRRGVLGPQAQECQPPPPEAGKGREEFFPGLPDRVPCSIWASQSVLQARISF